MLCYILLLSVELFSPYFFFFNDTATTEIYTLSLHDALPIFQVDALGVLAYSVGDDRIELAGVVHGASGRQMAPVGEIRAEDRKSTRLNSSHLGISYAVFCLKKKNNNS